MYKCRLQQRSFSFVFCFVLFLNKGLWQKYSSSFLFIMALHLLPPPCKFFFLLLLFFFFSASSPPVICACKFSCICSSMHQLEMGGMLIKRGCGCNFMPIFYRDEDGGTLWPRLVNRRSRSEGSNVFTVTNDKLRTVLSDFLSQRSSRHLAVARKLDVVYGLLPLL